MAYLGKSPNGSGVRSKFVYTASGNETSLSGADSNGNTLKFSDGEYVDVYLNGVLLVHGSDYGTGTANTISSLSALTASDVVEILVYDIFTMAKVNSEVIRSRFYKTASGSETSISGNDDSGATITFAANAEIEVKVNGVSLVQGTDYNTSSANTVGGLSALSAGQVVEIIVYSKFTLGDTVSKADGGTFGGNIAVNGDLTVDTTTLKVDSSNNRVGIGTASPAVLIHGTASAPELRITSSSDSNTPAARMYYTGGSGWNFRLGDAANNEDVKISTHGDSYFNGGDVGIGTSSPASYSNFRYLQVNATTNAYLKLTNNTTGATINDGFDVAVSGSDAMLINRESANMTFATAGNERMRIDSSGNVGIGTSSPSTFSQNGSQRLVVGSGSGTQGLTVYAGNASYSAISFADGTSGTAQYAGFLNYNHNGDVLQVGIAGSERARFTTNGLTFNGDTAAANALDDYEEGLHVTTATPNTSGSITLNSSSNTMAYTKIGRLVLITGEVSISSVSSPVGSVVDFTVPFACSSLSEQSERAGGGVFWTENGVGYHVLPFLTFSGSIIRIFKDASAFSANDSITFGVSYLTDS